MDEWFGKVRWCEDDLKSALNTQGYPVTKNNIAKLYDICSHHCFTDCMIEAGWEYMYNMIGYDDGWDKYERSISMNNEEFQARLAELYKENPMIARSKSKTVNELVYVLRQDKEFDYNISMTEDGAWTCIPSVKECFIPVRTLAKHVKDVYVDAEDGYECEEICLTVVLED